MVGELRLNFKKGRTQNSVSPRLSFALKRWDGKYIYIHTYVCLKTHWKDLQETNNIGCSLRQVKWGAG